MSVWNEPHINVCIYTAAEAAAAATTTSPKEEEMKVRVVCCFSNARDVYFVAVGLVFFSLLLLLLSPSLFRLFGTHGQNPSSTVKFFPTLCALTKTGWL